MGVTHRIELNRIILILQVAEGQAGFAETFGPYVGKPKNDDRGVLD